MTHAVILLGRPGQARTGGEGCRGEWDGKEEGEKKRRKKEKRGKRRAGGEGEGEGKGCTKCAMTH